MGIQINKHFETLFSYLNELKLHTDNSIDALNKLAYYEFGNKIDINDYISIRDKAIDKMDILVKYTDKFSYLGHHVVSNFEPEK